MTHAQPDTLDQLARTVTHLQARVDALEAWRAHQTDLLDEHLNDHPDPDDIDDGDAIAAVDDLGRPPAGPAIGSYALIDWVADTVAAITARPLRGEYAWCPLWWEHPEAVFRFEALHNAWTELAPEPGTALSIWIRDHLDPCLQVLLSPTGPFTDCTHTERRAGPAVHRPLPTLPTTTPP